MRKIKLYSPNELKDKYPGAYAKVMEQWKERCADWETPWQEETMDSLKAVVRLCGAKMVDWNIGPYSASRLTVDVESYWYVEEDGQEELKRADWFVGILPEKYTRKGPPFFTGHCELTGYCADDVFLKAVYQDLREGKSLKDALEGLAHEAAKMMEADEEQQQEEDSMLADWGDMEAFTIDGELVRA